MRLWMVALILTAASAVYQRVSGPTYPASTSFVLDNHLLSIKLPRTHAGPGDAEVRIPAEFPDLTGDLTWRRHKTQDPWTRVTMSREGDALVGRLPHQPPAGKLEYRAAVGYPGGRVLLMGGKPVVIRFRGDVPAFVLVPHVLAMFFGMLLATRAALEAYRPVPDFRKLTYWTLALLTLGGMILGPFVQKYAFGEFWTGWPYGSDLTDNKTAIAWLAWVAATVAVRKAARPARWVVAAALITLVIFAIPHSVWGSEIDYSQTK